MNRYQSNPAWLFKCLAFAALPAVMSACAFSHAPLTGLLYTGMSTPVRYSGGSGGRAYEVIGVTEGKGSATSVLGIVAAGDASARRAYQDALSKHPGTEGLVDVAIDQTHTSFLLLFASYTTTVRAKAVRWVESSSSVTQTVPTSGESAAAQAPPTITESVAAPVKQTHQYTSHSQPLPFAKLLQGTPGHSIVLAHSNFSGDHPGGGLRLGYAMRRRGAPVVFSPAVSHGVLSNERTFSYEDYDFRTGNYITRQGNSKTSIRLIPLDFNLMANFGSFEGMRESLPPELNPFAEAGLSYLIHSSQFGGSSYTDWDFFALGLNLGIGAEYSVSPTVAIVGGLKRYFVFDSPLDFWNWQIGVSFYPQQ